MLLVRETRAGLDEIRHFGALAINSANFRGQDLGDVNEAVSLRSTGKPFLLGALLNGVLSDHSFTCEEIAVMSSSHNGEAQHVSVVLDLLRRFDISPELLRCGVHDKWRPWSTSSPVGNNCSGKHTAFLIAAKISGLDMNSYLDPTQEINAFAIAELARVFNEQPTSIGIDGCSLPTCAFSLKALAQVYRKYATGDLGESYLTVRDCHRKASFFVGGTDRLESYLIANYGLAAKSGSDGLWAIGVPRQQIGLAAKVWSGSEPAAQLTLLQALDILGAVNLRNDDYLSSYISRTRTSLSGLAVGRIEACFTQLPLH